jgi:hypothetical protein
METLGGFSKAEMLTAPVTLIVIEATLIFNM